VGPAGPPETASAGMTVQNEFVIVIAAGTGDGDHHFPANTHLRPGTTLTWRNDDGPTLHIIHGVGFIPHQNTGSTALVYSVVMPNSATDPATFSCHSHGHADVGTVVLDQ